MKVFKIKIGRIFYMCYYYKGYANKLLVIGFLRKYVGFRYFYYFDLKTKLNGDS